MTGSPVTPESAAWFYANVKEDLWVSSPSGGTELCAAIVGGSPVLPVYAGEIQTRLLGMDAHAWNDEGREVFDEVGELVVTSPSPSMPLSFWNDPDDARYKETYFERFPGVWRHGDFIKINARGGCYIYGRSDSTLNRFGVRIGSAEIYRAVEQLDDVADSLIVCLELPGGNFYMPLFVQTSGGAALNEALQKRIVAKLRGDCSPRHVPDEIHQVQTIPYAHRQKDGDSGAPHSRRRRPGKGCKPGRDAEPGVARLVCRFRSRTFAGRARRSLRFRVSPSGSQ